MRPLLSAYIAKNNHLVKPTRYYQSILLDPDKLGIKDYQDQMQQQHYLCENPVLRQAILELENCDCLGNYIFFEHEVVVGSHSLVTRYPKNGYANKHLSKHSVAVPEDKNLKFFYDWLDEQNIFDDYGRVTFFINFPGSGTPIHKDYAGPDSANNDEFVLINLYELEKKFFMYEPTSAGKTYISGVCNWFNTGNYHGSEPSERACYTLRVDGVFNQDFIRSTIELSNSYWQINR